MVRTYENAQELKEEISAAFRKYIAEFDDIPEALKDKRIDEVERTPAVWEVYRFIHVNTVAPFGSFRTKIRKWKRMAL